MIRAFGVAVKLPCHGMLAEIAMARALPDRGRCTIGFPTTARTMDRRNPDVRKPTIHRPRPVGFPTSRLETGHEKTRSPGSNGMPFALVDPGTRPGPDRLQDHRPAATVARGRSVDPFQKRPVGRTGPLSVYAHVPPPHGREPQHGQTSPAEGKPQFGQLKTGPPCCRATIPTSALERPRASTRRKGRGTRPGDSPRHT